MTAAVTVINTDDDIDLIGLNAAVTASAISVASLTHRTANIPAAAAAAAATLAMRNGMHNATAAATATATAAMTGISSDMTDSGISNFSLTQPTSFVYVAAAAAGNIVAAAATTSQENISFAYDDGVALLSPSPSSYFATEPEAINRSLLLSTVSAVSATASVTIDEAADWSHLYDHLLSWQGICLIAVFCTFIVITIIGNTLIILAVITTRRLKTVTNCFVMSLAVADLLVGIFVMPPAVAVHLIGSWQLGWVLCDIWISLDVLLCTASILSLCAISVDRYLAVTQPLTYSRKRRSKRLALIMILIVWILALAITCPPILGWYEPGRRDLSECRYNQNEGYVIFSAMGSFFIPMAVMIYVYARISCVIASRHDNLTDISVHNKKFKRYTSADVDNDIDHDLSEMDHSSMQKKQAAARTFSNQTIAKELHEVMLSEGDNGSAEGSRCHSLLALPTANMKNGCYELTRPESLKRTSTASSTMTTMTSACGGIVEPQWPSRPHSMRQQQQQQQQQLQQQRLSAASGMLLHSPHSPHNNSNNGNNSNVVSSSNTVTANATSITLMRPTRAAHHHHHHVKSISNRISSLKKENKTTQTLSIVVGGFIVCWLPFFIYYLITPFLAAHQFSHTVAKVLTWLGWFNSAINPFIYAFYSVDFRAAFWRLTCKRFFSGSMKPQFPSNTMSIRR